MALFTSTRKMRNVAGFTLVELITVLVVGGILTLIAMPNLRDAVRNFRLTSEANEVVGALNLARSEAVTRARQVTVCRSANGTECITAAGGWEVGWVVYQDADGDGDITAGEEIRVYQRLTSGMTLRTGDKFKDFVNFQANGSATGAAGNTSAAAVDINLRLCDERQDETKSYLIGIGLVGRINSTKGIGGGLTCP